MKNLILLFLLVLTTNPTFAVVCTVNPTTPYVWQGGVMTFTQTGGSGGVWSTSNTALATIGSSSGILTPLAQGTVTLSYTAAASCRLTVTVHAPAGSGPGVILNVGTATGFSGYVTINNNDIKRQFLQCYYNYSPGDSTLAIVDGFTGRLIVPPTVDTNFVYGDSLNHRAYNMGTLRTWIRTNLE